MGFHTYNGTNPHFKKTIMIKIVETDVIAKKCLNVAVCKTCEVTTSIRLNSKVKRCV